MLARICFLFVFLSFAWCTPSAAVEVFQGHPRLLFRDAPYGEHSITTEMLKKRAADPRYRKFLDRVDRGSLNFALRALLLDDSQAALECISRLEKPSGFGTTTDAGRILMWDAMAFDWLYNHKLFSEESKQKAIRRLVNGARRCMNMYYSQGTHIFHTRMSAFPAGVAVAGLALKGHHPEADKFLNWGYNTFIKNQLPARQIQDGTVHNSMAYGRKYTMWLVGNFLSAWYTATGEDLWKVIRQEQGDWAWREALFCIYGEQPDGKMVRFGDNFYRGTERFSFRVISERAFYYDEPVGFNYINHLLSSHAGDTGKQKGVELGCEYMVLLYWDPDNKGIPYTTLPGRILFSPRGTGMAFWRTGWNRDDTFIFFKCGDYFGNHGHFDAGHLEVFRRAPLLIESGSYRGGTNTEHYKKYFHTSLAHNTIRIVDPTVENDRGDQRFHNNQTQGTMEEHFADREGEYGDVIQYRDEGDWAYLAADFTAAYPSSRAKRVVRELVWIGARFLVVIDNLTLAESRYQPRVLWHYPVRPVLEEKRFTVSDAGARAVVNVLAPADAVIDTVPGFKVGANFYPPAKPHPSLGVGRAEVSAPLTGKTDHLFVEVIDVADDTVEPAPVSVQQDEASGTLTVILPTGSLTLRGPAELRSRILFSKRR